MATRRYGQYCAIAKALDALGDRWALLIVRELLFGGLRYSELQAALPGIATDMLATRLRELEAAGVISRGPDARRYELTPRGLELRPVLEAVAVWGLGELNERSRDDAFDPKWLAFPISGMVRPERAIGVTLSIRLVVDGDETTLRVEDGHVGLSPVDGIADVTIEGAADALASAVAAPGSPADRGVEVRGDSRQVDQLLYILGMTDTPHSP